MDQKTAQSNKLPNELLESQQQVFKQLLLLFDVDEEKAIEAYLLVQKKVVAFFTARTCRQSPEELSDIVFDRVLKRVAQGQLIETETGYSLKIRVKKRDKIEQDGKQIVQVREEEEMVENIRGYFLGVARLVYLEDYDRPRQDELPDNITAIPAASEEQFNFADNETMTCLHSCLEKLSAEDRSLIVAYYNFEQGEKKQVRERLVKDFNLISANALRIRVCRIKSKLEKDIKKCLQVNRNEKR